MRLGSKRININKNTLEVIKDNWLWGTGTGDFHEALYKKYKTNGFKEGADLLYNAHNQYFEEWARGGIPAILVLIVLLCYVLFHAIHRFPLLVVFHRIFGIVFPPLNQR